MPFMLVAGDHAKNDMAGEEDSWKCELEDAGYEVRVIMKGLGEFEESVRYLQNIWRKKYVRDRSKSAGI